MKRSKASSAGAAALLERSASPSNTAFPLFGDGSPGGVFDDLDAELQVALRRLSKKDETTRVKALEDLSLLIPTKTQADVEQLVGRWAKPFLKLCQDPHRRVREGAICVLSAIVTRVGRALAPHVRALSGAWLCATFDPAREVSRLARELLQTTFPDAKRAAMLAHTRADVITYAAGLVLNDNPETLCDPKQFSKEEVLAVADRLRAEALSCLAMLVAEAGAASDLEHVLESKRFWSLIKGENATVRRSFYQFIRELAQYGPAALEAHARPAALAVLSFADADAGSVLGDLWTAALQVSKNVPAVWSAVDVRKAILPGLVAHIKSPQFASPAAAPCLLPFIATVPKDTGVVPTVLDALAQTCATEARPDALAVLLGALTECVAFAAAADQTISVADTVTLLTRAALEATVPARRAALAGAAATLCARFDTSSALTDAAAFSASVSATEASARAALWAALVTAEQPWALALIEKQINTAVATLPSASAVAFVCDLLQAAGVAAALDWNATVLPALNGVMDASPPSKSLIGLFVSLCANHSDTAGVFGDCAERVLAVEDPAVRTACIARVVGAPWRSPVSDSRVSSAFIAMVSASFEVRWAPLVAQCMFGASGYLFKEGEEAACVGRLLKEAFIDGAAAELTAFVVAVVRAAASAPDMLRRCIEQDGGALVAAALCHAVSDADFWRAVSSAGDSPLLHQKIIENSRSSAGTAVAAQAVRVFGHSLIAALLALDEWTSQVSAFMSGTASEKFVCQRGWDGALIAHMSAPLLSESPSSRDSASLRLAEGLVAQSLVLSSDSAVIWNSWSVGVRTPELVSLVREALSAGGIALALLDDVGGNALVLHAARSAWSATAAGAGALVDLIDLAPESSEQEAELLVGMLQSATPSAIQFAALRLCRGALPVPTLRGLSAIHARLLAEAAPSPMVARAAVACAFGDVAAVDDDVVLASLEGALANILREAESAPIATGAFLKAFALHMLRMVGIWSFTVRQKYELRIFRSSLARLDKAMSSLVVHTDCTDASPSAVALRLAASRAVLLWEDLAHQVAEMKLSASSSPDVATVLRQWALSHSDASQRVVTLFASPDFSDTADASAAELGRQLASTTRIVGDGDLLALEIDDALAAVIASQQRSTAARQAAFLLLDRRHEQEVRSHEPAAIESSSSSSLIGEGKTPPPAAFANLLQFAVGQAPGAVHDERAIGYLLAALLCVNYIDRATFEEAQLCIGALRDSADAVSTLLGTVFDLLELSAEDGRPSHDVVLPLALRDFSALDGDGGAACLAAFVYFRLLEVLPAVVRSWWSGVADRQSSLAVERFTERFCTPALLARQMAAIDEGGLEHGSMKLRASRASRTVTASYALDGGSVSMEVALRLPATYPLHLVEIVDAGKRVGVSEQQWRRWLLSMTTVMSAQNGTVMDALLAWKLDVDKRFEGLEECAICYCVVQPVDRSLPKLPCKQCKHKFHAACLFKWFKSSNQSTCPLCRNIF